MVLTPAILWTVLGLGAGMSGLHLFQRFRQGRQQPAAPAKPAAPAQPAAPGFLGHLAPLDGHPLLQLVAQALAANVQQVGEKTGHAALNAIITKLIPAASPFLPLIDSVVGGLEGKLAGSVGKGQAQAPAAPAPDDGSVTIKAPAGHPIIDALKGALLAHQQQKAA